MESYGGGGLRPEYW